MLKLKGVAVYAAVIGLALSTAAEVDAGPGCRLTTHALNAFEVPINLTKLELGGPGGWTTKWEGQRKLARSDKATLTFNSGNTCKNKLGETRKWRVRITRKNGKQHVCSDLGVESTLKLVKDGCSVRVED